MSKSTIRSEAGFLAYEGFMPGSIGVCHLRIIYGSKRVVFLVSELSNNPGPSVTGAIKGIWKQIQKQFPLLAKEAPLLIEHYNDTAIYGDPEGINRYAEAEITNNGVIHWHHKTIDEIAESADINKKDLIVKTSILTVKTSKLEREVQDEKIYYSWS